MQKNYIILAHKNPQQLKNLIDKLNDTRSNFYIHIDKNIDIKPFANSIKYSNVKFITNREEGTWCDIGIVKASINSIKQINSDNRDGYCILLSGQDFPIKSNIQIDAFLTMNNGKEFIEIFDLPTDNWFEKGLNRISSYKFNLSNKRGDFVICPTIFQVQFFSLKTIKTLVKLLLKIKIYNILKIFIKRSHPNYINPCGGSLWWCLTTETTNKIILFIEENPKYLKYHKYSLSPDEMVFQSIVKHLFNDKMYLTQNSLTFVDWEREDSIGAPIYTIGDYDLLMNQPENKLFARKFDPDIDQSILEKLQA